MSSGNLNTFYNEIINDSKKWNYYKIEDYKIENSGTELYHIDYEKFIEETLSKSGKKHSIDQINQLSKNRKRHIVSTYFLGIMFYNKNKKIKECIDKKVNALNIRKGESNEIPEDTFLYLWFLIALFHDLGYVIEENLFKFENDFNIKYDLKNSGYKFIPELYSDELLNNYNKFRMSDNEGNKKDHGLYGGNQFYENLVKIREAKEICPDGMYWEKDLENAFQCAAWTIMCHNIFYRFKTDCKFKQGEYEDMPELIIKKRDYKIELENHPFLFLFDLVDSIEPTKSTCCLEMFKKINIDFVNDDKIKISIIGDVCFGSKKYIKKIYDLNNWLTPVKIKGNSATITILGKSKKTASPK